MYNYKSYILLYGKSEDLHSFLTCIYLKSKSPISIRVDPGKQ